MKDETEGTASLNDLACNHEGKGKMCDNDFIGKIRDIPFRIWETQRQREADWDLREEWERKNGWVSKEQVRVLITSFNVWEFLPYQPVLFIHPYIHIPAGYLEVQLSSDTVDPEGASDPIN